MNRPSSWKIFAHTFGFQLLVTAFVATVLTVYALHAGREMMRITSHEDLTQRMDFAYNLSRHIIGENGEAAGAEDQDALLKTLCATLLASVPQEEPVRLTVLDAQGEILADNHMDERHRNRYEPRPEVEHALTALEKGGDLDPHGFSERTSMSLGRRMLYCARALRLPDGSPVILRFATPSYQLESFSVQQQRPLFLVVAIVLLFSLGVSYVFAYRRVKVLASIITGVRAFAQGNTGQRIPVSAIPELADVTRNINQMADQLTEKMDALRESRDFISMVHDNVPIGLMTTNEHFVISSCNPVAIELLNRDVKAVVGQEVVNLELRALCYETLSANETRRGDIHAGNYVLDAKVLPLHGAGGIRDGLLIVLENVTELRHLETVRRDFVANVAHELRTPITSIEGFSEILAKGPHERAPQFGGIILRQVRHMDNIVNDLLALASLESDAPMVREFREAPVGEVIRGAVEECRILAERAGAQIDVTCPPELTAVMNPELIEQAVANLLSNALKYGLTDARKQVEIAASKNDAGHIVIRVTDFGQGIPAESVGRVFERFYRVDKGRSREMGGTGLGLAVVKHIAQVHNGRATVESTPGKGSSFYLDFPAARQ